MFCCAPNFGALHRKTVLDVARSGDLLLYCKPAPSMARSKSRASSASVGSSWLECLPLYVALSGGVRPVPATFDSIAVVIEKDNVTRAVTYSRTEDNVIKLCFIPLDELRATHLALRPLIAEQEGNDCICHARRSAVRDALLGAAEKLVRTNARPTTSIQLTAMMLFDASILVTPVREFCGTEDDINVLYGADSERLRAALRREYAYGHEIWSA